MVNSSLLKKKKYLREFLKAIAFLFKRSQVNSLDRKGSRKRNLPPAGYHGTRGGESLSFFKGEFSVRLAICSRAGSVA